MRRSLIATWAPCISCILRILTTILLTGRLQDLRCNFMGVISKEGPTSERLVLTLWTQRLWRVISDMLSPHHFGVLCTATAAAPLLTSASWRLPWLLQIRRASCASDNVNCGSAQVKRRNWPRRNITTKGNKSFAKNSSKDGATQQICNMYTIRRRAPDRFKYPIDRIVFLKSQSQICSLEIEAHIAKNEHKINRALERIRLASRGYSK